jgi:methionine-rich copper-binding protein CopC
MALTPVTTETIIARNFAGLFGKVLGFQSMNAEVAKAGLDTDAYLNVLFLNNFANATSEVIANLLVTNTGITDPQTVADATEYVIWVLDTNIGYNGGKQFLGAAIDDILDELRLLEGGTNEEYGAIAAAWNAGVDEAVTYSQTASNTDTTFDISDTAAPVITAHDAVSYAENAAADAVLATISATDNVGVTGFEITTGNDDGFFAISATGEITLTEAGVAADAASNDFETTPNTFTLGVVASDAKGNKSAAVDVVFNVTDVDDTAPTLVAATLANTTVKLNFNETLQAANLNGTAFSVVDANNANITVNSVVVSGTQVTLTLAATPTGAIKVGYTAPATGDKLQDAAGNVVANITDQTAVTDVTAPTLSGSLPADNATAFVAADNLVLTFSEDVLLGTGNITIVNAADATDTRTIAANDATQVSVSGKVVTINPAADLKTGVAYYVNIPATAVLDLAGNAYAGISNATTLNFTTVAAAGTPGETFVLTNSLITGKGDELTGKTGDDTFNALTLNTLETGDKVNGAEGTDTLDALIGSAAAVSLTVVPLLTSVEKVYVQTTAGTGASVQTLNLASSTGYTELWSKGTLDAGGFNDLTFTNIGSAATKLGMINVARSGGTGFDLTNTFTTAALAGASDTIAVTLNNVGQSDNGGTVAPDLLINVASGTNGAENLTITTTGAAARLGTLASEDVTPGNSVLKLLTINGDQNLRIENAVDFAGGTGTVDAAAFTGALNLNLSSADDIKVTGGSGNDRFAFGANLTAADQIDGGLGTDTLAANLFTDIVAAANASRLTSIEAVELQAAPTATATLDVSKVGGVNAINFAAGLGTTAITSTISNIASGATITIAATGTDGVQVNVKDANLVANTTDVLNLVFGTAATAAEFAVGTINATATGIETINVSALATAANSGTGAAYTATIGTDATLKTINVSGSADVSLTYAGASLTAYDASTATGTQTTTAGMFSTSGASIKGGTIADTLIGNTGNDTIDAGAGNDTITGGLGSDKITTGAGSDKIILSANGNTAGLSNTVVDTITDFTLGSGGDVLAHELLGANTPTQDLLISKSFVSSLTGALASGGTDGRSELIILDSTVPGLLAADSLALTNLLFNLSSANYGNVLVAYSATAGGDVRLATATIVGGDITNVVDMTVLQGITTASLNSGFNAANLSGLNVPITATAAAFNTLTGLNLTSAIILGANNTINTTGAFAVGSTITGDTGTDTLAISDGLAAVLPALTSIENITLAVAHAGLTVPAGAFAITGSTGADTVILGNGVQTYNTNGGIDAVTLGAAGQTVTNSAAVASGVSATAARLIGLTYTGNAGGADTLTITDTPVNLATAAPTLTSVETISFSAPNAAVTATAAQVAAATTAFTATGGATEALTLTTNVTDTTLDKVSGFETLTLNGTGAQNITTVDALVAAAGTLTVTNPGNGILTFNGAAETNGAFNITGGTAADVIIGGAGADTITGGASNDTITVGAGADHIVFAATAATNGADTITDFLVSGADKLDFTAFLGGPASVNTTAFDITGTTGSVTGAPNVAVAFNKVGALVAGDIATATGANKIAMEDNSKAVILTTSDADGASDAGVESYNIYYVEDSDAGAGQTFVVTLVGTLTNTVELNAAAVAAAAAYV